MNPAIRKPTETQKQYRERRRRETSEGKERKARVLWDSRRGSYIRDIHGPLSG